MSDRLAVVGCGAAARWIHLPALERIGWTPRLFVDPNLERAVNLSTGSGAPASTEYEPHLEDFDAALIAVPHAYHADLACSLLERGKHVFVEKPLALNSADAERMVNTAARTEMTLSVGLMRRQLSAARWLKLILEQGALGGIQAFDVREGSPYEWMVASDAIWRKESAGGGVLVDLGAHVLDLLDWWLGPLEVVEYIDDSYGGVEADCLLTVATRGGATGTIELSRTRKLRQTALIRGERATIEVGTDSNTIRTHPESLSTRRLEGVRGRSLKHQTYDDLFDAQLSHWRAVVNGKAAPAVTGEEAMSSLKTIEEAYRQRRQWSLPWVDIPPKVTRG